jgi:hypothetical protein
MYLKEVEKALRDAMPSTKRTSYFEPGSYLGTGFLMFGLDVPQQRGIFKKGYSFSQLPLGEQLDIWDTIWKEAEIFETLTQAMFFPEKHVSKLESGKLLILLKKKKFLLQLCEPMCLCGSKKI